MKEKENTTNKLFYPYSRVLKKRKGKEVIRMQIKTHDTQ